MDAAKKWWGISHFKVHIEGEKSNYITNEKHFGFTLS